MYLIHTERVWAEKNWRNLLKFIKKHKSNCHLFLMSPNLEYQWSVLSYRGTYEELKEILTKRYKELKKLQKKYRFKVGIHLHISLFPDELTTQERLHIFQNAYEFIKDIFGEVDGVVFGWYKSNHHLDELAQSYKLKIYKKGFHDYDLFLSPEEVIEYRLRDFLRRLR